MRVLQLDDMPHNDEYETLAGFLMVMLRRVPRRTDHVNWKHYKFEVLDVDSYRIDQVMVTRMPVGTTESAAPVASAAAKVQGSALPPKDS